MNDIIQINDKSSSAGVVVYEYELKIGWGKSVALPSQALPAPPPGHMAIRSKEVCLILLWCNGSMWGCILLKYYALANFTLARRLTVFQSLSLNVTKSSKVCSFNFDCYFDIF